MRRLPASFATASNPEWSRWASVRLRANADEARFTGAEILTILRAAEEGAAVADLCAAEGIAVSTYYVWKVKYGGLPISRLESLRRRKRRSGRTRLARVALVAAALGAGYSFIAPRRTAPAQQFSAVSRSSVVQALPQALPAHAPVDEVGPGAADPAGGAPQETNVDQPVDVRIGNTQMNADDIEIADPTGYSVQVAALPDLGEARTLLRQLAADGYPAYLTRKDLNQLQLYRVRVGPLESPDAAEEVTRRLELQGHRKPWVTK